MIKKLLWSALIVLVPYLQAEDTFSVVKRANRKTNTKMIRSAATNQQANRPLGPQLTNGDEQRYADKRGSYGKGLRQLDTGLVDPVAFNSLVIATQTGNPADFNRVQMALSPRERGLHSPQAGISYNLWGADNANSGFILPPAPTLVSAQKADEMVELYWMRLLADVPFADYATNELAAEAIENLNTLSDFRGPKVDGEVTAQTLFRSGVPGALVGPYVSQLLYRPVPFSDTTFIQQYRVPTPFTEAIPNEFLASIEEYLFIQLGHFPKTSLTFDETLRFIRNGRDLGNFVHADPPQLPWIFAAYVLFSFGAAAQDAGNPYLTNPTQEMFAEFFMPQVTTLIALAGEMGIRAAWYQKWFVQRTLRPEEYGFLVHQQVTGAVNYGLNSDIIQNTTLLDQVFAHNALITGGEGTYLLAQGYPEGAPIHPSYPAGHATCAGACATIIKAWFNEDFVLPSIVTPNAEGTELITSPNTDNLTLGGEVNKLAANIATGRNMASVHYRCDMDESLKLGEAMAIQILEDWAYTNNINFAGFSLTKFDGTKIKIGGNKRIPLL